MTAINLLGHGVQLLGVLATVFGLWCAAGGLRAVVSNRVDERRQSGRTAKIAVPFIVSGVTLLLVGTWVAGWAAGG
jgi:hypothetical protein